MNNPLYENIDHRATEDLVRKAFSENGWKTKMTPTKESWDIECVKPALARGRKTRMLFVEVRGRVGPWGQYSTYWIDVAKVEKIAAKVKEANTDRVTAAAAFVIVPDSGKGTPRFAWLLPGRWETNTTDVQAHRNNPNDRGDEKYDIPLLDFHRLNL